MKRITLQNVRIAMLLENFIAVLFVSGVIYYTTNQICESYHARDFINSVRNIPQNPLTTLITVCMLYLTLLLLFGMQDYIGNKRSMKPWLFLLADFIICILIVAILDFNYNGILFLVFASFMYYIRDELGKYVMIILALGSFILTNSQMLTVNLKLYSISDYIAYYDSSVQNYLIVIYNFLISINIIFFIVYCMLMVQEQRGTIQKINLLNEEINKKNEDLQNANSQLEEYAKKTEHMGQMQERNRLAREIHDTLGHTLTGIAVGLDAAVATVGVVSSDSTKEQLTKLSDVARNGLLDIRRSVNELKPDSLDKLPLKQAIVKMITDMRSITDMEIYFECNTDSINFDEDEESAIYRVIQEGITNAMRHGKASKVRIVMNREMDRILLTIKDNGIGCDKVKEGFGTKHMLERIGMLNGTVEFESKEGCGFTVIASIPIRWGEEHD